MLMEHAVKTKQVFKYKTMLNKTILSTVGSVATKSVRKTSYAHAVIK